MTETTVKTLDFLFNELDRNVTKTANLVRVNSSDLIRWLAGTEKPNARSRDKIERAYRTYMDRQELDA